MNSNFHKKLDGWPAAAIALAAAGLLAFFAHQHYIKLSQAELSAFSELTVAQERNYHLLKILAEREATLAKFQGTISDISTTLETLEKLSHTDPELLKKYSKVYFLNENYTPPSLADIEERFLLAGSKNFFVYAKVWPYLRDLLIAAERPDLGLKVASAYRSFGTQAALKTSYKVTYGSGANAFSADQGYSEHQLGTTVDFTTSKLGADFSSFSKDVAYQWLLTNAYKYGFVLSYPEGNAFYKFEPWHWRFVGVKLATDLREQGKHFYDLDQREIDKYLVNLFD